MRTFPRGLLAKRVLRNIAFILKGYANLLFAIDDSFLEAC